MGFCQLALLQVVGSPVLGSSLRAWLRYAPYVFIPGLRLMGQYLPGNSSSHGNDRGARG